MHVFVQVSYMIDCRSGRGAFTHTNPHTHTHKPISRRARRRTYLNCARMRELVAHSLHVDPRVLFVANNVLAIAVSAAPILSPQLISGPCALFARLIPLLGRMLAAVLEKVARTCEALRLRREQAFVLVHGAVTYACGDLIAQATLASRAGESSSDKVSWVPAQTLIAAVVGLLSDTLPFYHWSSLLAKMDVGERRAALERRLPILARQPSLILPLKILVHLATFQPLSTGGYLVLQGLARSGGVVGAVAFAKDKFAAAMTPALISFAVGGPLVYSLPVVAGAALRNLGVLAMCIYLAYIAAG